MTLHQLAFAIALGLIGGILTLDWGANIVLGLLHFLGCIVAVYKVRPEEGYVRNVLIGLDQFANALIGGDPNETISSRSAKARANRRLWGCVLCLLLGWIATIINRKKTDHCAGALMPDAGAAAIIPDGD
jgi:hypothetical protein